MFHILVILTYFVYNLNSVQVIWDNNFKFDTYLADTTGDENEIRLPNMNLIFPGTKWCGPSNISSNNEDLGEFEKTDKCCREHDFCDDIINGYQEKHNLTNPTFYSRLHCNCDNLFYKCLKTVNDKPSSYVGSIYFNVLDTKCFREEYPIKKCARYNMYPPPLRRCKRYNFDTSKMERYQWFDLPLF